MPRKSGGVSRHNKLVRDGIPARILRGGEISRCKTLAAREKKYYLVAKLVEEAKEAQEAFSRKNTKKDFLLEIADAVEVIDELLRMHKVSWNKLRAMQTRKRRLAGGFKGGTFLVSTRRP
ncbi:MAG: hypothetical protein RLZZ416_361 [Candidatus Parcubacteria bacterium]|jgi:predicted house-cleaning noncanonical NTP pyrophosphatase (MazG superfamily)